MTDEKVLQSKYLEFQMVDQQVKRVQQQLQQFDQQIMELESVRESLEELKLAPEGSEMLVPISGGIFIQTVLKNNQEVRVNVGANVVVGKTVDETKQLMEKQAKEIESYKQQLMTQLNKLVAHAEKLEAELKKLIGE